LVINKKNVFYWSLYDFANALVVITFALYFSQWMVIDHHVSDLWYNLIFVGASVLLVLTGPVLGVIADKHNLKMPFLKLATVCLFLVTLAAGFCADFGPNTFKFVVLAAIGFLLSNYFYPLSLIFYNSFLPQLAPAKAQGKISGLGYASHWFGQFTGLFIALAFASGAIYFFGRPGRAQPFIPVTILFLLLSLPMLFLFKDTSPGESGKIDIKIEYKNYFRTFWEMCRLPGVGRFLLGFFLFNDAIVTLENNFAIYLQQVFQVSDKVKSFLLLGILGASVVGAFVSGFLADKIGLKKSLIIILAAWVVLFPILGIANNLTFLFVFSLLIGLLYGATWTVTRAVLTYLVPAEKMNHGFSYYNLAERFATLVGPVSWGLVNFFLLKYGPVRYRVAVVVLGIFILIGAIIVRKIPSDKTSPVLSAFNPRS